MADDPGFDKAASSLYKKWRAMVFKNKKSIKTRNREVVVSFDRAKRTAHEAVKLDPLYKKYYHTRERQALWSAFLVLANGEARRVNG